jgi:hypothetical protein
MITKPVGIVKTLLELVNCLKKVDKEKEVGTSLSLVTNTSLQTFYVILQC